MMEHCLSQPQQPSSKCPPGPGHTHRPDAYFLVELETNPPEVCGLMKDSFPALVPMEISEAEVVMLSGETDNRRRLSCRAYNKNIPGSTIEDHWDILVMCE